MELHQKQIEILQLLISNQDDPLTLREIMINVDGLTSPSHVQHHINQLEKKGYLKKNPSNPRDYKVLLEPEKPISYINLYGMAKCGPEGTLLSGNPIDRVPVYSKLIRFDISKAFLLQALGDSMEPLIHENDLVIAKSDEAPFDGDIIICSLDHRVYIKKYRNLNETIMLESLNKHYKPMIISDQNTFEIEGLMKGNICSHMDTIKQ